MNNMKFKIYTRYKDSSIQWIGKIPEGWEVRKLSRFLYFQEGPGLRNWQFTDKGMKVLTVSNITPSGINWSKNELFISEEEYRMAYKHFSLEKNDLVFASSGITMDNISDKVSKVKENDLPAILNTSTIRIHPKRKGLMQKYFYWFLRSDVYGINMALLMTGSCQFNFGPSHLSQTFFILPTKQDQIAIANFLDKETAQIDALIEKDKRLIGLLKEKRAALINHVVTKGLDPNAKMKDSGIQWIGEIPEGWEVKRLKFLTSKINSGVTPKGGAEVYTEEGIPLLRSQNIHFEGLKLEDVAYISEEIHKTMLNSVVKNQDVLINITGASIGRCTYIDGEFEKANVNQHVCIIRPKKIDYKYLTYFLRSKHGQDQVFSIQIGSSREGLNFEQLGNFAVPFTLISVQIAITSYLDKETAKIDKTIQKIQKKIELLEEYKKSLIHHTVTGKIDVRGLEY